MLMLVVVEVEVAAAAEAVAAVDGGGQSVAARLLGELRRERLLG